jgi:hypothetical protein
MNGKLLLLGLILLATQAGYAITLKCYGVKNDLFIKAVVEIPGLTSLNETTSTIYVDGVEVASFREGEVDISILGSTFKGNNNYGDKVDGKIEDISKKNGFIKKMIVPRYEIDITNMKVKC